METCISANKSRAGGLNWVAFMLAFSINVGGMLQLLGTLFYLRETLHASKTMVGVCMTANLVTYALGSFLLQPRLKHLKARVLVPIGLLGTYLCTASLTNVGSVWFVLAVRSCAGLSLSFIWTPLMGWLYSDMEGKELSGTMSRYNLSWSIGTIIAPLFAGWMSDMNVYYPLVAGPSVMLVAIIMLAIVMLRFPAWGTVCSDKAEEVSKEPETPLRFPAWAGLFSGFAVYGILMNLYPVFMREELQISKSVIGVLFFVRAAMMTLSFFFLGRTSVWHHRKSQMLGGQALLLLMLLSLLCTRIPLVIGVFFGVIGTCIALIFNNSVFHGLAGSRNRSVRAAIHEGLMSSGIICGSVAGAALYQYSSMHTAFLVCSMIIVLSMVVQALLMIAGTSSRPPDLPVEPECADRA